MAYNLREVLDLAKGARRVSAQFGMGTGLVLRKTSISFSCFTNIPPSSDRVALRYDSKIFDNTVDGLQQACLHRLMKTFYTRERFCEFSLVPTPEMPSAAYSVAEHQIIVHYGRTTPYKVYMVICKTYWFPVGLRFQTHVTLNQYNICIDPF